MKLQHKFSSTIIIAPALSNSPLHIMKEKEGQKRVSRKHSTLVKAARAPRLPGGSPVVGCGEDRHELSVRKKLIAVLHHLVRAHY